MQVFEVVEVIEDPYCGMVKVMDGTVVRDVLNKNNKGKAFLLIDHDTKRIWTYHGPKISRKKLKCIELLAKLMRQQLKMFYRVYPLDMYSQNDPEFQELMNKQLEPGRAIPIKRKKESVIVPISKSSIESMIDYIKMREEQVKTLEDSIKNTGEQIQVLEEVKELKQKELLLLTPDSHGQYQLEKLEQEIDVLAEKKSRKTKEIAHLREELEEIVEDVERLKEILKNMIREGGDPDSGFVTPFPPFPPGSPGAAGSAKRKGETTVLLEEPEYELICKYCGSKLAKAHNFCKSCGNKVE